MVRFLRLACFLALAAVPSSHAQSPAAAPSAVPATYDVSTVKPSKVANDNMMVNWNHGNLNAQNVTLAWFMTTAFHARMDQIAGQPGWANDQHFDITAKLTDIDQATAERLTPEQTRRLIRALLVERFGLKYHEETRIEPVYELLPSAKGVKRITPVKDKDPEHPEGGVCAGCFMVNNGLMKAHDIPMSDFVETLAANIRRTVIDKTNYTANLDVTLHFAPEDGPAAKPDEAAAPPLPIALEEQMGLRLVSTKGPVTIFVIDHLDKPEAN